MRNHTTVYSSSDHTVFSTSNRDHERYMNDYDMWWFYEALEEMHYDPDDFTL